jgi:hypothetical protein
LLRRRNADRLEAKGDIEGLSRLLRPARRDVKRGAPGQTVDLGRQRRVDAAERLGRHPGEVSVAALRDALDDPEPSVRAAAARALVQGHRTIDADIVTSALGLAGETRDTTAAMLQEPGVRPIDVLGAYLASTAPLASTFGGPWAVTVGGGLKPAQRGELARSAAQRLLDEPADERALQVAHLDPQAATVEALSVADGGKDGAVVTAIEIVGELRHPSGIEWLRGKLADADPRTRRAAAAAIGRIKHPVGVEALLEATLDEDFDVREEAMRALDGLGSAGTAWSLANVASGLLDGQEQKPALPPETVRRLGQAAQPPQPQPPAVVQGRRLGRRRKT